MLRFLKSSRSERLAELDDASLLARFQESGRPEDLTPLFERYLELTYSLCLRYLGTATRAEDATMELFSFLTEKLPHQEVSNYRSWLQTVVRNHCLMQLRREKREVLENSSTFDVQLHDQLHQYDESPETDDRMAGLSDCIAQLKEQQRQCVELFYLQEGNTYKSISEQLGLELGKVRSFIQNGRRNLRLCLEAKSTTNPQQQAS